mmetsp:Transcript_22850/g.28799  ORF Transcript_22850/g.28799 Transcript_22850/m.28799 type:complete len:121 (+) Transcript_22850:484-846(+)
MMKEGGKKCNFLVHTFDDSPSFPRIPIESTCTVNSPLEGDDINITCSQFDAFEKKALEHCSIKTSVGAPPPPTRSSSRLAAKKMSSSSRTSLSDSDLSCNHKKCTNNNIGLLCTHRCCCR